MSVAAQNRQGAATRLRLVKAAEKLFAAQGVDAVSVRAVNAAAGLGAASVHYHFGSKDDLLRAVLTDIGAPVRDEIAANVAALAADPSAPSADALVRAVTEPYLKLLLRHRVRGMRWIKIIAQISQDNNPVMLDTEQHLPEELFTQVQRAFPDSDPARLELRWAISIMNFIQALSRADGWRRNGNRLDETELRDFYEDLVRFVVGGVDRLLGA